MNFSLLRMFVCLFFVALPFSVLSSYGSVGIVAATLVAIGVGGLALTLQWNQWKLALRTVVVAVAGASFGFTGRSSGDLWEDFSPRCVGAVLAVVVVRLFLAIDRRDRDKLNAG